MRSGPPMRLLHFFLLVAAACGGEETSSHPTTTPPMSTKANPACADGERERERYGTDCGCCHAAEFAISGSVELSAMNAIDRVEVVDSSGQRLVTSVDPFGNFFRHRPKPVLPLTARLIYRDGRVSAMKAPATNASCNGCHRDGGDAPPIGTAPPSQLRGSVQGEDHVL